MLNICSEQVKEEARENVERAYEEQLSLSRQFNPAAVMDSADLSKASEKFEEFPQPKFFVGELKAYQLKGMNWLVSLYDQVQ